MTRPRKSGRALDGVLILDKPTGIGSNAVLQQVRRLYGAHRAGHTGTLDPMASGVLPVCFGEATKFAAALLQSRKAYRAEVTLGVATTTADAEGEIVRSVSVEVDRPQVEAALRRFLGEIEQVPPMHSAIKLRGVPLYAYARRGESVPRGSRKVTITRLQLLGMAGARLEIDVACSKGTYIRVLAEDLGTALGCGAHLSGLVRTRVGRFGIGEAHALSALAAMSTEERERVLLAVDALLEDCPPVLLQPSQERRFRQGQPVALRAGGAGGMTRVFGSAGNFLGTGRAAADGTLHPVRLLASGEDSPGRRRSGALGGDAA